MDKPILPREIKKIFEGRVFSVTVETITLPKGHELKAEIVRHPPSVVILPITSEGDVILVRQYRHPIGRWMWELPAGSMDKGEEPEAAAIRECHEETGLVAERVERLGTFFPTPGYCDEEFVLFKATGLREPRGDEQAHADEDEDIEPKAFAMDELRRMIEIGEIVDLKTVAGVFLWGRP
jgi:ADP-ribose pyrophosphatase